jgi:DNA-binding protein HU-beta
MNKSELVSAMSEQSGLNKSDCEKAYKAFVEVVKQNLANDEKISLIGFGTFLTRDRKARTGRNPKTGEAIQIKASKNPSFKAGKALKDAVN